jgi:hypothetical protein
LNNLIKLARTEPDEPKNLLGHESRVFDVLCFSTPSVEPGSGFCTYAEALSRAWSELQQTAGTAKHVTLHAQITAAHGSIKHVTVQETEHLPHTASEVQSWIQQQWKFVPAFSGTVVQPLSFQIVKAAAAPTSLNGSWPSADRSLFVKSPNPGMPVTAVSKIKDYLDRHRYWPGVLLLLTAKEGVIVDLRVLDQKGPTELSGFTVAWVRKYWRLRPDVTGTYRVPVYYGWD